MVRFSTVAHCDNQIMDTIVKQAGIGFYSIKAIKHSIQILTGGKMSISGESLVKKLLSDRGHVPSQEGGNIQIELLDLEEEYPVYELPGLSNIGPGPLLGSDFHLLSVLACIFEEREGDVFQELFCGSRPVLVRWHEEGYFLTIDGEVHDNGSRKLKLELIRKFDEIVNKKYRPLMVCSHK